MFVKGATGKKAEEIFCATSNRDSVEKELSFALFENMIQRIYEKLPRVSILTIISGRTHYGRITLSNIRLNLTVYTTILTC